MCVRVHECVCVCVCMSVCVCVCETFFGRVCTRVPNIAVLPVLCGLYLMSS